MMERDRPSASELEGKVPEAWIGQEVMIETTGALSSDLRAATPVYLEDVNDRGVVILVTRHKDQGRFSRYFYPWSVIGWIRLAEKDEQADPADRGSS
jgi:sensor histidine kinase regulating citrate/malate metabolism